MSKLIIPCPKCGRKVIFSRMVPYYEQVKSGLLLASGLLLGYDYDCPCGAKSFFNKDVIREAWQEENRTKQIIRKL